MRPARLLAPLVLAATLASPTLVHAFCRTTTVERAAGSCPEQCITEGLPLYWPDPDPTYVFNERGFPGLDDATMREALADSFGAWNAITCSANESIGLDIRAEPGTTSLEVGPASDEPNDNVIVHFSGASWRAQGLNPEAYALTAIWYDKRTGKILGADMHFNGGMGQFGVCSDSGCTPGSGIVDLRNVATHEAGHFIGLAHSDVPDSTMWCSAEPGEVVKRSLASDDIAGACEIYPSSFTSGPSHGGDGGASSDASTGGCSACSVESQHNVRAAWLSLLAVVGLVLRRRRRSP